MGAQISALRGRAQPAGTGSLQSSPSSVVVNWESAKLISFVAMDMAVSEKKKAIIIELIEYHQLDGDSLLQLLLTENGTLNCLTFSDLSFCSDLSAFLLSVVYAIPALTTRYGMMFRSLF